MMNSVQEMASEEAFNYHSGLWLVLSHIILSQTCSKFQNDSIEDSEVENRLEIIDFLDLVKDAKSVADFSSCFSSFKSD